MIGGMTLWDLGNQEVLVDIIIIHQKTLTKERICFQGERITQAYPLLEIREGGLS